MEEKLFDWEDYDIIDTLILQFYNCKLKEDIAEFKTGSKIDCITMDYDRGLISLKDKDVSFTHTLILTVL